MLVDLKPSLIPPASRILSFHGTHFSPDGLSCTPWTAGGHNPEATLPCLAEVPSNIHKITEPQHSHIYHPENSLKD